MIKSIILDFCSLDSEKPKVDTKTSDLNLVESIIIKYFGQSLVELSQDRVVNVRISLAECFHSLQLRMDELEEELLRIQKGLNSSRLKGQQIDQQ